MAGRVSQPDLMATGDVHATTTKIDGDTQEIGTSFPTGFPAHERFKYEFTPAAALDADLDLTFLAEYPDFDVDFDWDNLPNEPSPTQTANAPEAQDLNDYDDGAPAEQSLDETLSASAMRPEDQCSSDSPNYSHDGALTEQSLDRALGDSATSPESHSLPYFPNTHHMSILPQIQFISAQESNSASQDSVVDSAELVASAVEDLSDLFGISDCSGGRDLGGFVPQYFELPDNPSGLDFLQGLQLIGTEKQPPMSPDIGHNTQQLPYPPRNGAIQVHGSRKVTPGGSPRASCVASAGSSEPNPTTESRAILRSPRRLSKGHRERSTQRQPGRSRIQRKKFYIENSAYTPLDQAPEKWDVFEYTRHGELDPVRLYTAEEINRFLFSHPLHQGHRNLKESQLRLRVHKTPASSAKRFPNKLKCRFKDCPSRTINQGQLLVIVDELSVQHPNHDHFLNAAYFHLWCMERFCDFPEICAKLNVSAKGRTARKEEGGKNKFCLSIGEEERVVEDFVEACANGRRGTGGNSNPWVAHCPDQRTNGCPHFHQASLEYNGTLCHQLVITKLHYGGQGRLNLRKGREDRAGYGGANITNHLGDLSKEAELREYSRSHRNQNQLKPNPKTGRRYRANGQSIGEEEEPNDSNSEPTRPRTHQPPAVVSPHQAHGTKRNRDESEDGQNHDADLIPASKKPRSGPDFKTPEWDLDQSRKVGYGNQQFENTMDFDDEDVCMAGTPGMSPRTTITPKSRRTRSQLSMRTTSLSRNCRSITTDRRWSTSSEDESEREIRMELLAAQKRRRALEIENVKATEDALEFKLEMIKKKKRAREEEDNDGDGPGSRVKRQRARDSQSS